MTEKDFITGWTNKLNLEGIKTFPEDFISFTNFEEISLPGKTLIIGEEFFGAFEILSVDGSQVMQADTYDKAKYIVYANRLRLKSIRLPLDEKEIKDVNTGYEKYLDALIKEIESDYKSKFPLSKNFNSEINEILRILNLVRY